MKSLKFHAFLIEYPNYGIYKHTETSAKIILEDSILAYEKIKEEYNLDESQILIFGRYKFLIEIDQSEQDQLYMLLHKRDAKVWLLFLLINP